MESIPTVVGPAYLVNYVSEGSVIALWVQICLDLSREILRLEYLKEGGLKMLFIL